MTNRLTLAAGNDFWDGEDKFHDGGALWCIRWEEDRRMDLTPKVEMWCVENLRQWKVKLDPPHGEWNCQTGTLIIEFQHAGDMLLFRSIWGDA